VEERVLAVPMSGALTVQGPASATLAEVYDRTGRPLSQVPLVGGTGSAIMAAAAPGVTVRFVDAGGAVVLQSALSGVVG
jgi:hypothetical protein